MAAISLTYEFKTTRSAIQFVAGGTELGLMVTLRYGQVVHVVTTSADVQEVNDLAKVLGGEAVG